MSLEKILYDYGRRQETDRTDEARIDLTVQAAKEAFYEGEAKERLTWMEFLFGQAAYIQKRWWTAQAAVLGLLWVILYTSGSSVYLQRSMGILAPVFAVLLLPELWKNRTNAAVEIEGAAYFSLRKIYAARMLLFAMADLLLLTGFFVVSAFTLHLTVKTMIIHFFLPLNVTCCIVFRSLCSQKMDSEYYALVLCMGWIVIWTLLILKENIYRMISGPVWAGSVLLSLLYLAYSIVRINENNWEVNQAWN